MQDTITETDFAMIKNRIVLPGRYALGAGIHMPKHLVRQCRVNSKKNVRTRKNIDEIWYKM